MVIVPTIGGRFQRHPSGLVGYFFRVNNPDTIRVGHCFMNGRLKPGDLMLCTAHSGDCFQNYILIEEFVNGCLGLPQYKFGSYGVGDSDKVTFPVTESQIEELKAGKFVKFQASSVTAERSGT